MHPTIPTQSFFFYRTGIWTQKLDRLLLSHVLRNQGSQRWAGNAVPNSVINLALDAVIKEGGATELCFNDVKLRLDALKARYTLFSETIATRGVRWMVYDNMVIADEFVWSKLLKKNPLAGAYYYRDEPQYSLCATIWGILDFDIDDETTIIISSYTTTELVGNFHGPYAASPADPDEVNSPCVRRGPKAKRKLFVDESETGDNNSYTAVPPLNLATTFECPWKLNMDNQAPRHMDPAQMNHPKFSHGGSSIASCSPCPGARKIAP